MKTAGHVLVINLGGIGDVLLSIPALKALRELYSGAEISMLVTPSVSEVLKKSPYVDSIYTFFLQYGGAVPIGKIFHNGLTLLSLRRKHVDLAINMRTISSPKSARKIRFLLRMINPGKTVGRDTEGRGSFFDIRIPETYLGQRHEMQYDIETVKALGAEVHDKKIELEIPDDSVKKVDALLSEHRTLKKGILIGIHPGGMNSRRWPAENFLKVMDEISKRTDCIFVVTGGCHEAGLAQRLKDNAEAEIVNLAGRLAITELFELIKRCDLYISNDTGPLHIAAILHTPLVAILGPGDIERYNPTHISERTAVIYKKSHCAPCAKVECSTMKCLSWITPDMVIDAGLGLLRQGH